MSIEQKIADLLEESKKLQEVISEEAYEALSEKEQTLYELSKKTLGSYVKKSANDMAGHEGSKENIKGQENDSMYDDDETIEHERKGDKRQAGISKAVKRLTKEHLDIDVSEDVAALINGEELSEEFKTKAATIFEAAVVNRVKQEIAKLDEQFETSLAEQVEEIKEGLVEKVDGYLNYVVEQWMTDNELALENGMKSEIMESFITGMKGLFEQHYIDVPEEKFDVLGEMQEEISSVKAKLDEQLASNVELTKQVNEMKRVAAIAESAAGMVDTDVDKFSGLAAELAFEDVDTFKTKLQTIKENYFGKKVSKTVDSVVTDEPVQLSEETISPRMAATLRALGKK